MRDRGPELVDLGASLSLYSVSVATLLGAERSAGAFVTKISEQVADRERELEEAIRRCGLAARPLGPRTLPNLEALSNDLDIEVTAKFGDCGMAIFRLAVKFTEAQAHLAFSVPYKPSRPALTALAKRAHLMPCIVLSLARKPRNAPRGLRDYVARTTGKPYYYLIVDALLSRRVVAIIVLAFVVIAAVLGLVATLKGLL